MDVQVEKTGSYLCKLSVSIPAGDVDSAFDKAMRKVSKAAQIPGFRPGKVPRHIIERQFGAQIHQEVQTQLVEDSLYKAMDQAELSPVAMPKLQVGSLIAGTAFSYTAEVEIRPEISLQNYQGLSAPALEIAAADDEVEKEIEAMRKQAAQLVPVTDRTTVQEGDVVQVDYAGSIDGVPFEGGKADNAMVEIGGEGYIPGFAEGLVGATVPGQRDVPVTFPADYSAEQLAGKQAVFAMTLKELKARELPGLDDEFAKDMGEDSLAILEKKVRDGINSRLEQEAQGKQRDGLLKSLVEANPFEVPPSMVETQTDRIVAGAAARVERMVGQRVQLSPEQIENLRTNSRADAEFQVRSGLLLLEVAKAEKLEVSDDEVNQELDVMAQDAGEQAEQLRSYYADPQRREELHFRMLEDRVITFLLEKASLSAPETAAAS